MIPHRKRLIWQLAKAFDVTALTASLALALAIAISLKGMTLTDFLSIRIKLGNFLLFAVLLTGWHYIFVMCGLYVSKRLTTQRTQLVEVLKATTLAAAFLLVTARVMNLRIVSNRFVAIVFLTATLLMILGRVFSRMLMVTLRRKGRNRRFILIVGTNERAISFARQIADHPELGYQIVGFVDDEWPGIQNFEATGHQLCSTFARLAEFLRHNVIDEAAIYLPLRSYYEHAAELVSLCEHHGIVIRFDSQVFKLRSHKLRMEDPTEDLHVVAAGDSPEMAPAFIKRTLDCVLSFGLLIACAPLFALVAVLIKLTSQGPVFFSQARVGLNKRKFSIYKFRTMVANAEQLQDQLIALNEMSGPVFKIAKDPRITPLGRILRKMSIDELPQLLNVLKGDMSLVGPRAMSLRDYQLFDQDWQRRRFSVKPGITCLWQIYGRNSIPFNEWMELDMQYIDKWSLWLDLKILARTVPAVLRGTGAA